MFQLLLCPNSFPGKCRNEWEKEVCSSGLFMLVGDGKATCVVPKNSRQPNWANMKMLYWRVRALGRTNVPRKIPFFLHRRCCHIQMHDRKCWHCLLVAVGCERDEGDKVRNAFLILHHVLLPWSILTFVWTAALTKKPRGRRSTDQSKPASMCPLHHQQCLGEGELVALSVTL